MEKKRVVGIILKIDKDLLKTTEGNYSYDEFLKKATCELSNIDIHPANYLTCKYYDDLTGKIYFHFDRPIRKEILEVAFEEKELIMELDYNK